jgi:hypothetical protein
VTLAAFGVTTSILAPASALAAQGGKPAPEAVGGAASESGAASLESAASRASKTGRAVAMSLIALALAIAAVVLAFRRDFREAVGVLAVGIVAVLLATPTGLDLLRSTVASLFGGK